MTASLCAGAEGTADVQAHPWFSAHIDFGALGRMELSPIYVPTPMAAETARETERAAEKDSTSPQVSSGDDKLQLSALLGCFDLEVTCAPVDRALFRSSSGQTPATKRNQTRAAATKQEQQHEEEETEGQAELWANYVYTRPAALS